MTGTLLYLLFYLQCVLSDEDRDLRLVGSHSEGIEGRVEIYHLNKWGTICDDWWGKEEAKVACKQLGYPLGAQYWYSNAYFGKGNGTIWLDDVVCVGNETKLKNCRHNGWGGHNCEHYEDVGVLCRQDNETYSTPGTCDFEKGHGMCGYQDLVAKNSFNWTFGSRNTRSYRWPKTDHTTADSTGKGFYATTFMNIWEDIMQGQQARLQSPTITSATCVEFFYFMRGTTVGELLVYLKSDKTPEKVVWQLIGDQGYKWNRGVFPINSTYKNFHIIFEGIAGTGYYGSDVAIDDISVTNATSCVLFPKEALPVPPGTPYTTIRLVPRLGSAVKSAGRVEVYHKKRWGTVCNWWDNSFDIKAATVVCKDLGYEGAEMVIPCCEAFGKGTGRIWLDRVKCLGTEPSITMCPHGGWGNTFCSHDHDVSVVCKTKQTDRSEFAVRLGNETGVDFQGRVEVNIGGIWGTVTDNGWDIYDANVACNQLGFKGAVGAFTGSNFGRGHGPIWMSDFNCTGTENKLSHCNHTNTEVQKRYGHYLDASVECYDLKLVDGGSRSRGRLEVRYGGIWGTVCSHKWDIVASNVVCKQLGYKRAETMTKSFGAGLGPIFLDKVQCSGDEPGLSFCRHRGWEAAHNCTHHDDIGVICTNATCNKKVPCSYGGICVSSGICNCTQYYVGELCQLPVENETVRVEFAANIQQWNKTSFIHKLVQDLNTYCSANNCSASLSKVQKGPLVFEDLDIQIVEKAKKKDKYVAVGFVVLYTDGQNTVVMPRSFIHKFISSKNDKLAGYRVIMVDGEDEGSPGGRHSTTKKKSSKSYIYIIVGVVFGIIVIVALVFVVKRYGKRLGGNGGNPDPSRLSDQSYLALHAEDYDESMDDTALLRPPQQPTSERDLLP